MTCIGNDSYTTGMHKRWHTYYTGVLLYYYFTTTLLLHYCFTTTTGMHKRWRECSCLRARIRRYRWSHSAHQQVYYVICNMKVSTTTLLRKRLGCDIRFTHRCII